MLKHLTDIYLHPSLPSHTIYAAGTPIRKTLEDLQLGLFRDVYHTYKAIEDSPQQKDVLSMHIASLFDQYPLEADDIADPKARFKEKKKKFIQFMFEISITQFTAATGLNPIDVTPPMKVKMF